MSFDGVAIDQGVSPSGSWLLRGWTKRRRAKMQQGARKAAIQDVAATGGPEEQAKWLAEAIALVQQNAFYMHRALVSALVSTVFASMSN